MISSSHNDAANLVGVLNLSDMVLASLSSTAAPEMEAAPVVEEVQEVTVVAKPKKITPNVAYVHVPDCIACNACEEACPSGAIEVNDHSVIDPSICESCNLCVPVCPTSCISLQPRESYASLEFAIAK